jgi:hypothetical protein
MQMGVAEPREKGEAAKIQGRRGLGKVHDKATFHEAQRLLLGTSTKAGIPFQTCEPQATSLVLGKVFPQFDEFLGHGAPEGLLDGWGPIDL